MYLVTNPQKKETPMTHPNPEEQAFYNLGWENAIDMVLDAISEMQNSMDFHNPTLDELEQRIV
jgi:hypothetical protein